MADVLQHTGECACVDFRVECSTQRVCQVHVFPLLVLDLQTVFLQPQQHPLQTLQGHFFAYVVVNSTGVMVTASLSLSSAVCCASPQNHRTSLFVSSLSGFVLSDRCGRNLKRYCATPRRLCTPAVFVGVGISTTARTLAGSTRSPLSVAMCPKSRTCYTGRIIFCNKTPARRKLGLLGLVYVKVRSTTCA